MRKLVAVLAALLLFAFAATAAQATPTANFTFTPTAPVQGQPVTFKSTSLCDRTPCTYRWTNPATGGTYSTATSFSLTYNTTGSKQMRLTVTNRRGRSASSTKTFTVTAAPPPPVDPANVTYGQHCQPSETNVTAGDTVDATGVLTNTGGTSITLQNVILAGRPPGGTNGGGPFSDFTPAATSVTLAPGDSYTIHASRQFTASDPTGSWYCFLTYQAPDGSWHDDPSNTTFTVGTAPPPPPPPPPPSGTPIRKRVGINIHMNYGGVYSNTAGVAAKLADLGVQLIRDVYPSDFNSDALPGKWNTFPNVDVMAYCPGIWQFSWGWTDPKGCVDKFKATTTRAVVVEGANEPYCNSADFANHYTQLRDQMVAIRDEANAVGLVPYTIGMCNADNWGTTKIPGLVNNTHSYNSSSYPSFRPASVTFSTQWWTDPATGHAISDSGRWGSSETGTALDWSGNDQTNQARNNLIQALNGLLGGYERFALYQLADESCSGEFFGWYDCNGNPRAVVGVMRNFYTLLGDASTGPLSGVTASVTDPAGTALTLTARDSSHQFVVLWNRASTAARNVTLTLDSAHPVRIYRPMVGTASEDRASSASHVISLDNDPVIVQILQPL